MLESLIRLAEAHARLLMKSQATVFDAICIIILIENSLMTCLFGVELPPPILFDEKRQYLEAKSQVILRLGLDPNYFENDWNNGEVNRKSRSPSPIRRLEESLLLVGRPLDNMSINFDLTS